MNFLHFGSTTVIFVLLTLSIQSWGMAALIEWLKAHYPKGIRHVSVFQSTLLMVRFTGLLVCLHLVQILLWTWLYRWKCLATWEAAFYFAAGQYASVGSSLALKPDWRAIAQVESVTGVLMSGLSAGFLFTVVTRLIALVDPEIVEPEGGEPGFRNCGDKQEHSPKELETATL
jgi:voltage-gated potassium channel